MNRRLSWFTLFLLPLAVAAQDVVGHDRPLATGPGATAPHLAGAMDTSLYVSWLEPSADGHTLRIAAWDREADGWEAPHSVVSGPNFLVNAADTPIIAAGLRGHLVAVWYALDPTAGAHAHTYQAFYRTSEDRGETWSETHPLSPESATNEFVSVVALINGKWLAVWLDGRTHATGGDTQLYSRLLGSDEPDQLIDDRVCDCCSIATLILPNGAVLAAYRDRSADEIRDIAYTRYSRGAWSPAAPPTSDGWKIAGCPVNGPHLSRRGAQVAVAWYQAADGAPHIMTARSTDIGQTWNFVGSIEEATHRPVGAVSSVVLRDGSQWIAWLESPGALALRSVDQNGLPGPVLHLETSPVTFGSGHGRPRLAVLDEKSGQAPRLMVVLSTPATAENIASISTSVVELPTDPDAAIDDCGCGSSEPAAGHPLRGQIQTIIADRNVLLVAHEAIPGVLAAVTTEFHVDPRVLALVEPGQQILAQAEPRADGLWWLSNLRILKKKS